MSHYPPDELRTYRLADVDDLSPRRDPELVVEERAGRADVARNVAIEATIYGLPSVLQYEQMYEQAVDATHPRFVGFNRFAHDRHLAGPGYAAFKTPNADTLYSNAWLDLTTSPVVVELPAFGDRYYALHFLDAYSNSTNLSLRTAGPDARRFVVAPIDWHGEIPAGTTLFRVATPQMWILMRIFSTRGPDVDRARALQEAVQIRPISMHDHGQSTKVGSPPRPAAIRTDAGRFLQVLDHVLRTNGHPAEESALVYRFRTIGIAQPAPFDIEDLDEAAIEGLHAGFAEAMGLITKASAQLGTPLGHTYWRRGNPGSYGFNYIQRAATNHLGLGANIVEECQPFNCFRDSTGAPLDGGVARYTIRFASPPPARAFWSLTLYETSTRELYPNEFGRYAIGDRTEGLHYDHDGSFTVTIQHEAPGEPSNWLPAPEGQFYLIVRAYVPEPELVRDNWSPGPTERLNDSLVANP